MQLKLKEHNNDLIKFIEKTLKTNNMQCTREYTNTTIDKLNNNLIYQYNCKFWDVAEKFIFPKNILLKYG